MSCIVIFVWHFPQLPPQSGSPSTPLWHLIIEWMNHPLLGLVWYTVSWILSLKTIPCASEKPVFLKTCFTMSFSCWTSCSGSLLPLFLASHLTLTVRAMTLNMAGPTCSGPLHTYCTLAHSASTTLAFFLFQTFTVSGCSLCSEYSFPSYSYTWLPDLAQVVTSSARPSLSTLFKTAVPSPDLRPFITSLYLFGWCLLQWECKLRKSRVFVSLLYCQH